MIKAPFPWFGGKSTVAAEVWERFGNVRNYVEPFAGSLAVLLGRPNPSGMETVNDKDAYLSNFWRALKTDPDAVADFADYPVNENDLHARHIWLVEQKETFRAKVEGDPHFYCAKTAGWWVWGVCTTIGGGWCSGNGPWSNVNGMMVKSERAGIKRQIPTHRRQGINRIMPRDGKSGVRTESDLTAYLSTLASRFRDVRVCSGDWQRVLGPGVTANGIAGIFLDPPYSAEANRVPCYAEEDFSVSHDVRAWCVLNGSNPLLRIALCGYAGEGHEDLLLYGWSEMPWKATGGYASLGTGRGKDNAGRERIWFSPACVRPRQFSLFEEAANE